MLKLKTKNIATLNSALKPIFLLCACTGIISFKLRKNLLEPSEARKLIILTTMVIYISTFIFVTWQTYNKLGSNLMQTFTNIAEVTFPAMLLCLLWINSIIKQHKHIEFIDTFNKYDNKFKRLGIQMYYPNVRKTIYISMLLWIAFDGTAFMFIFKIVFKTKPDVVLILFVSIIACSIYINQIIIILIYIYAGILKQRFKIINEHVRHLQSSVIIPNVEIINEVNLMSPLGSKLSTLRLLTSLHLDGFKIIKTMNCLFGTSLLGIIGVNFSGLIMSAFELCILIKNQMSHLYLSPIFQVLTYMVNIYVLCKGCHSALEEAHKTGILIHQIDYEEDLIKGQIETFSLQIANEQIEFNAAGFFNINFGLLFSIAGGITTYLIILIQFSDE